MGRILSYVYWSELNVSTKLFKSSTKTGSKHNWERQEGTGGGVGWGGRQGDDKGVIRR